MKVTKIVVIIVIALMIINTIMSEFSFKLPMVLPFMDGKDRPSFYEVAGIIAIVITLWGIKKLGREDDE